jgi:hypothetical protein
MTVSALAIPTPNKRCVEICPFHVSLRIAGSILFVTYSESVWLSCLNDKCGAMTDGKA